MSEESYLKVSDVMTTSIKTIDATATVSEAITMMRETGVSSLVTERRDDGDEFGLVVVSDIARDVIAKNRSRNENSLRGAAVGSVWFVTGFGG